MGWHLSPRVWALPALPAASGCLRSRIHAFLSIYCLSFPTSHIHIHMEVGQNTKARDREGWNISEARGGRGQKSVPQTYFFHPAASSPSPSLWFYVGQVPKHWCQTQSRVNPGSASLPLMVSAEQIFIPLPNRLRLHPPHSCSCQPVANTNTHPRRKRMEWWSGKASASLCVWTKS
jgi:hypothetical protein